MPQVENPSQTHQTPCLSIAIRRLTAADPILARLPQEATQNIKFQGSSAHFAIWVLKATLPGGYVHHDQIWTQHLSQIWYDWQEMFQIHSPQILPGIPSHADFGDLQSTLDHFPTAGSTGSQPGSYSARLMQQLGISLWAWLFDGPIQNSLKQSEGVALGQNKPLRLRLDIRDPNLIALPWEIMQPQAGKQAIALSQQILFSRTTSDVDPLLPRRGDQALNILLVLGQDSPKVSERGPGSTDPPIDHLPPQRPRLQLEQEALTLSRTLEACSQPGLVGSPLTVPVTCKVDTLVQPTPAQLIEQLESKSYNILFYAGHGIPAPDGGLLFLSADKTLSGTELAQVLSRSQVTLAVFNACWGAQSDRDGDQLIPRSSLAEVLLHHGVPAVLGMRDSITDNEALSFIQTFAQALAARMPIDQAVAVARQQLLTLYRFNQPAWTLPVLYMHPEFDGELIAPLIEGVTELPDSSQLLAQKSLPIAYLRGVSDYSQIWQVRGALMRVGRLPENDIAIAERWVSQRHAEIIRRDLPKESGIEPTYWLRDFSRYGTWVCDAEGWRKIHHQEVLLSSGVRLKFGSSQGQILEFAVEWQNSASKASS